MAKLDLDVRAARIDEITGALTREVLLAVFRELGLDAKLQRLVRPAVARQLRIAAGRRREQERPRLELAPVPPAGA
jgi:hypothetical protein